MLYGDSPNIIMPLGEPYAAYSTDCPLDPNYEIRDGSWILYSSLFTNANNIQRFAGNNSMYAELNTNQRGTYLFYLYV